MKLVVIYTSVHHQNTLKIIETVKTKYPDVDLIDANKILLKDLVTYDFVGVASGIYMGKFHKSIVPFLENNLPEHKKIFLIYTSGSAGKYGKDILPVLQQKQCTVLGTLVGCRGYDTYGPFKLVGSLE